MNKSKIENMQPEPQLNDAVKADGLPSAQVEQNTMLAEGISWLPIEKRRVIVDLLSDACMAINSVECELLKTELSQHSLFDGQEYPTLWCQIYNLKKLFGNV